MRGEQSQSGRAQRGGGIRVVENNDECLVRDGDLCLAGEVHRGGADRGKPRGQERIEVFPESAGEHGRIAGFERAILADDEIEFARSGPVLEGLESGFEERLGGLACGDEGGDTFARFRCAEAEVRVEGAAGERLVGEVLPQRRGEGGHRVGDHPVVVDRDGDVGGEDGVLVLEVGGDGSIVAFPERERGTGAEKVGRVTGESGEQLRRGRSGEGDDAGVTQVGEAVVMLLAAEQLHNVSGGGRITETAEPEERLEPHPLRGIFEKRQEG